VRTSARGAYLSLAALSAGAGTLAFTAAQLYRFQSAGLNPFQLVLVGTVMEAAVFVFEVPTGIVADLVSRRLSIVVGHVGMGLAFVLEGSMPHLAPILVAAVLWGVSYTFTSGATEAWLAGEVGDDALGPTLLDGQQVAQIAAVVGIVGAIGLGLVGLWLPLVVGGVIELGLGGWLALRMPETEFVPSADGGEGTWADVRATARTGFAAVRASRVLVLLALLMFVAGGASEAYDRYGEAHIVTNLGLPSLFGGRAIVWIGLISITSLVAGIVLTRWAKRRRPTKDPVRLTRWLLVLFSLQVIGLVAFGLAGSFWFGIAAALVYERTRSLQGPLFAAWVLPLTPPAVRATVLSGFGQCDAIGQVTIGPMLGVIATVASLPAALVVSAVVLAPGFLLLAGARRAHLTPPSL
jgi:DHA3 family tetracycline resistance protein-like MFS transporter